MTKLTQHKEVNFHTQGHIGVITLNRPHALNAVTQEMCIAMKTQLDAWALMPQIRAVVVRGNGERAFCAGGDLRWIYQNGPQRVNHSQPFFWDEYRLHRSIAHYPKPYISLCHGVTMGGGVGISAHASHRVGALDLKWAMPETGIGFFCDAGTTYFLNRLPGALGMYLGLTGEIFNAADALHGRIIDFVIPYTSFDELVDVLSVTEDLEKEAHSAVTRILRGFAVPAPEKAFAPETLILKQHQHEINHCFSETTLRKIIKALSASKTNFCQQTHAQLTRKSPTSLRVVFAALHDRPEVESIDEALRMEYRIATHFLEGHDFYEGIRAQIIDKDKCPNWKPNTLAEIKKKVIDKYFSPLSTELSFE